ncbi:hypothetical protein MRB53_001153 [Persea americana]|uniref:Uncharacterized protein n=1 Tax=Persea americana TaxID=3435 RepID=A0ACC2MQX4_PERAE|nr:hypothetical protein MRB53_001153 [Persea americana]
MTIGHFLETFSYCRRFCTASVTLPVPEDSQSQMPQMKTSCCGLGAFQAILKNSNKENGYSATKNIKLFSYEELKHATKDFHAGNRIGRGGFGTVYKGTLKNKTQVAVKLLSAESKQGIQEFLTEIDTITNVKHPNLVELIGCCVQGDNRILVYEYVENSSLDRVLLGPTTNTINLDWSKRSAICIAMPKVLLEWAWELYQEGRFLELVDPQLQQYPEDQIIRFIKVALFCTQAAAKQRPSMTQVVAMLSKKSRLHEKQLTPPGIIQDLVGITKSSNNQHTPLVSSTKDSSAVISSDPLLADSPVSVNEMIPR